MTENDRTIAAIFAAAQVGPKAAIGTYLNAFDEMCAAWQAREAKKGEQFVAAAKVADKPPSELDRLKKDAWGK